MTPSTNRSPFARIAEDTCLSIFIIATHTLVAAVIIAAFWGLEQLIHYLYGSHDPMVLGLVPLRFIVEGADVFLIMGVLFFGTKSAYAALRS